MRSSEARWAELLHQAYVAYHQEHERRRDPIELVHWYSRPEDREIVAFLVASLAYGNVATICRSAEKLLAVLGDRPAETLRRRSDFPELSPFRHRFTTGDDLRVVLATLAAVLRTHGSLENFFRGDGKRPVTAQERMEHFVAAFRDTPLSEELALHRVTRQRSMKYLLPSPREGSACKRLNMFLRWVVRPADGIDLGLWRSVDPADLFLPVDTHVLKVLRRLRWTKTENANWKLCLAATARLRRLDPKDPIRFDFSLCHLGMAGGDILRLQRSSST